MEKFDKSKTVKHDNNKKHNKNKMEKKEKHNKNKLAKQEKHDKTKMEKQEQQEKARLEKEKDKLDNTQMNLMRILIAQKLKEETEFDRLERLQRKHREFLERRALEAERNLIKAEIRAQQAAKNRKHKIPVPLVKQSEPVVLRRGSKLSLEDECFVEDNAVPQIIVGEKLCTNKDTTLQKIPEQPISPIPSPPPVVPSPTPNYQKSRSPEKTDLENTGGVTRYSLSNRKYIYNGWTVLPQEKLIKGMILYQMRPAHPELDWFNRNKHKRELRYGTGEKLAEFDDTGRCRLYYRNGQLALDHYEAEETRAGQRIVVYSTGPPPTMLAAFDYSGNGIVFDHAGNVRLKYNQTEGVVLDREIGPESHWKWHNLNDLPEIRSVIVDNYLPVKDHNIMKLGTNSEQTLSGNTNMTDELKMIAIQMQNIANEQKKVIDRKFYPYKIQAKAFKINEKFSLRVIDQAAVYLSFSDGTTKLKINIGMILDPTVILEKVLIEFGEVFNSVEVLPAMTDSIELLQEAVRQARAAERARALREWRLNPSAPRWELWHK